MLKLKTILQYKYLIFSIFLLTIIITFIRINYLNSKYDISTNEITGILEEYKIDGNKFSFIIKGKEKIKGIYYIPSEEELSYYNSLSLGISMHISGTLSKPNNNTIPNSFNYNKYLKSQKIFYTMSVEKIEVTNYKTNIIYKIKNKIKEHINQYKSKAYLNAFIIGDKEYLSEEITDTYRSLGISHIFAISGMHISILSLIILKLLKKFKETTKYIIVILFLLFYIFLTGYQVSVLRSVTLFILLYLNKQFDFNLSNINVYYLTIILLLIINPFFIYNIGFLYSSIISYTLIRYSYLINSNYIINLLKISTISFLVSLPITINSNYEFNLLSILNNLIFVPLISFIIFPLSLLTFIFPFLDSIYLWITNNLELLSNHLIILNIIIPKFNYIYLIIYYIFLYLLFNTYQKRYLLLLIILIFINKYDYIIDHNLYVYYLDVSQGDSTLIKYKNQAILIDTGGKVSYTTEEWKKQTTYYYTDNTIKFLKSIGITKINSLVLTHGDNDHMGEAIHLVENYQVDKVILNCGEYNNLESNLINVLNQLNINYYSCISNLKLENYNLQFLYTSIYDNENDNSLVSYLNFNNYQFLFMGDASTTREKDILDQYNLSNIDFIKVGHHGSDTSSSNYFINNIKPKYSIISVGKNNRYGHPKESVLDILESNNSKIYRTDEDGSIEIKINKNGYKISTFSP